MRGIILFGLILGTVVLLQYVQSSSMLHKLLKLDENASVEQLEVAYRKLLIQWYKSSKTFGTEADLLHLKIVVVYKELKEKMTIDFHDKHILTTREKLLGIEVLHSISVPLQFYKEECIQKSSKQLYLILFYSADSATNNVISNWFNIIEHLTPIGVTVMTVNMDNEDIEMAKNIIGEYPTSLPYVVFLVDGLIVPYNSNEFADLMIIDFVRNNVPSSVIQNINDMNIEKFLGSWHTDNKVRVIFSQPNLPLRFHYLTTAFAHRDTINFGFIHLSSDGVRNLQNHFNLSSYMDTFLLFKEDHKKPIIKISMPSLSMQVLNNSILDNNFLTLPRITSQEMFNRICRARSITSTDSQQRPICIILVIKNSLNINTPDPKIVFRRFIDEYAHFFNKLKISFMYLYNDYQPGFVLPKNDNNSELPYIIAVERIDQNRINYKFLLQNYDGWENYEFTKTQLKLAIEEIFSSNPSLLEESLRLEDFADEKPPSLYNRIIYRLQMYLKNITFDNILPYILSLGTVVYIYFHATSCWNRLQSIWKQLVDFEEPNMLRLNNEAQMPLRPRRKKTFAEGVFTKNGKYIVPNRELKLHELKAETYNGMVRLLKPGFRTLIVMFDRERADLLVSQFYKAIWPYRKNKNLIFGYANMDKRATLEWYSELVKGCLLEEDQNIDINPYFCAGTVLALSGMRKYFWIYHIKHPGVAQNRERGENSISRISYNDTELLSGLSDWLDKLFDGQGSLIRYGVNHWPEFKVL